MTESTLTSNIAPTALKVNKLALVGNPNSGKTSLFNLLTGLNQKVGNYPGITTEKKTGYTRLEQRNVEVLDLPGSYSLAPRTEDERIVADTLKTPDADDYPDLVLVTADMANLERNLMIFTQVKDLGIPVVLMLTMPDLAAKEGVSVDTDKLSEMLGDVPVFVVNNRTGAGLKELKSFIEDYEHQPGERFIEQDFLDTHTSAEVISERYKRLSQLLSFCVTHSDPALRPVTRLTRKADKLLVHRFWGYLILVAVLGLIFQAIFSLAVYPMDFIDAMMGSFGLWVENITPEGPFFDLITEGMIPGITGIIIFIPQIALLFGLLAILEETGYMARAVFIMDRLMRRFGLNGRSVVPLVSGLACAIPAIMSTRTIEDRKERLISIFVIPFMSCSARLPVYTIIISLIIPPKLLLGWINMQGLALLAMYMIGVITTLLAAYVLKQIIRMPSRGYFLMELPLYRMPRWRNVGLTMWQKSGEFVTEAGKIIFAISIILWVLAYFGPTMENGKIKNLATPDVQLEESYIGKFGCAIEPAIEPLGYDWKIGIAILTSYVAREVFVSTMATIYSVDKKDTGITLISRLRGEKKPDGSRVFDFPTGVSLLLFYAFAMQCMSTFAVVMKETRSWKWPVIQAVSMTILAYVVSLIAYQLLTL